MVQEGMIIWSPISKKYLAVDPNDIEEVDGVQFVRLCLYRNWLCEFVVGLAGSGRPLSNSKLSNILKNAIDEARKTINPQDCADAEDTHIDALRINVPKKKKNVTAKDSIVLRPYFSFVFPKDPKEWETRPIVAEAHGDIVAEAHGENRGTVINVRNNKEKLWVELAALPVFGTYLAMEYGIPKAPKSRRGATIPRFDGPIYFSPPYWYCNGPLERRRYRVKHADEQGKQLSPAAYSGESA